MIGDRISMLGTSQAVRTNVRQAQERLDYAQTALASGRYPDLGMRLGARSLAAAEWHSAINEISARSDRLGFAQARAGATQAALEAISGHVSALLPSLVGSRNTTVNREVVHAAAASTLSAVISQLNSSFGGEFIFAGLNKLSKPVAEFPGGPSAAIDASFVTAFGFPPDDPAVFSITAQGLTEYLDGPFDDFFSATGWRASWSSASVEVSAVRLRGSSRAVVSVSADEQSIRQLMEGLAMAVQFTQADLPQAAHEALLDKSIALLTESQAGIGRIQARIGLGEAAIGDYLAGGERERNFLADQLAAAVSPDPYSLAAEVNALMTQLEASYGLTARLQRLSLVNFL